jgi:spore germination protein YaaH
VKIGVFVFVLALVSDAHAAQRPALTTVMYLVNRPASVASFQKNWRYVSIIAPQCFAMDAQGFISGEVPTPIVEAGRKHRVALMPLVTNRGFNQPLMHTVLDAPESRARAIRYLLYYALRDGYIGFQFDYENIKYLYRDRFSQFFHEAAAEFHRHGLLLSAAVVGKYSDDRNAESPGGYDDWSGVYDYPRLARDADFLSIMAYPEHAGFSAPGPLAGLPWVRKIVEFTRSNMPASKISLGVPLYGFHWIALAAGDNAGPAVKNWKGRSSVYTDTAAVIAKHSPEWRDDERAHRVEFADAAGRHELWYEDARSMAPKLELAASQKLAGISAWVLGQEDPAIWELLARDYRILHPRVPVLTGSFEQRSKAAARRIGDKSSRQAAGGRQH